MALDTPTVTAEDPGRGGVGDTARGLPHRGIFKGDNVPLKWSFSIFSSIRKDGAGRGLGKIPPRGGGNVAKRQRGTARVRAA